MGLVFDTTILIASERKGETIRQLVRRMQSIHGEVEAAVSTISIVELTHGVYRAHTDGHRDRRRLFIEDLSFSLSVHSLSFEIAQLAGRIEGQQAARGFAIPFEDLIIGCTALHLDFSVATLNTRHFELIPGLTITSL